MTRLAIVTGASKGIGKATAETLMNDGWQVVNLSRSRCDISNVENLQVDLCACTDQQVSDQLNQLLGDKSPQQIAVVHNAFHYFGDSAAAPQLDNLKQGFRLAVEIPLLINSLLIPHMNADSAIVFVTSTLSRQGVANAAGYVTLKHAMLGLMRATAQDLAGTGIRSLAVAPGLTDTEMLRSHIGENTDFIKDIVCAGRLVEPAEIADFIRFCIDSPQLNGEEFHVNLGQIQR